MSLPPLNCGGCRTCCLGDTITLLPGDDPAQFKTKLVDGRRQLAKGKDGNCVYLGPKGCKIHGRAPQMCRLLDCRKYALIFKTLGPEDQAVRRAMPGISATLDEGFRRLACIRASETEPPGAVVTQRLTNQGRKMVDATGIEPVTPSV